MDMISSSAATTFNGSFMKKFRERGRRQYQYQRLPVSNKGSRTVRLGGKRKRSWKIKLVPKLKLAFVVALQVGWVLKKLWDGYMNVMLVLGGDVGAFKRNCHVSTGRKRIPKGSQIDNGATAEQFEDKFVYEIYKEMKASQELGF